jgi:hypothetical protein
MVFWYNNTFGSGFNSMIIYFAGNFPQIKDPVKEKAAIDLVHGQGEDYYRLVSYFFQEDVTSMIKVKEAQSESKQKGPITNP